MIRLTTMGPFCTVWVCIVCECVGSSPPFRFMIFLAPGMQAPNPTPKSVSSHRALNTTCELFFSFLCMHHVKEKRPFSFSYSCTRLCHRKWTLIWFQLTSKHRSEDVIEHVGISDNVSSKLFKERLATLDQNACLESVWKSFLIKKKFLSKKKLKLWGLCICVCVCLGKI